MKKSVFRTVLAAVSALLAMTPAFAGNLDQTAAPTDPASAMFTLEDIYQRLLNGTAGTKRTSFAGPTAGPIAGTGHTLDEVYNLIGTRAFIPKTGATADTTGVNFPNPRFTVNAGCTVTDNLTGRMWLKDANLAATVGYNPDGTGNGSVKWSNAVALITALNAGTAPFAGKNCGYTDWRLPNLRELQSLIHYGYANPALSDTVGTGQWTAGNPFDNLYSGGYCSATPLVDDPAYAWDLNMGYGQVQYGDKNYAYLVLPVR